ncbi:TlpA disulfide reductase family protein [Candidatus Omnitrophota bacterium]
MKNKFVIIIFLILSITIIFSVVKLVNKGGISELNAELEEGAFKEAPDFTLLDVNGDEKRLSDFKGSVIVLNFWASWCPPCRAEIPDFIELYDEYKDEGLEIIGIALDQNPDKIIGPFIEENKINYPILLGDGKVDALYGGIVSIPTTFLIDREGGIRKKYRGFTHKRVFEEDIKELL